MQVVEEDKYRAQVLQQSFSVYSDCYRIRWTVDARKLKTTDREAVSPTFDLGVGSDVQFKMVMRPRKIDDGRGGASFKKAKGKGSVQLRMVTGLGDSLHPKVTFRLAIGNGTTRKR